MTTNELGLALGKMYREAPKGESALMVHLFGIRYASQIKDSDASLDDVVLVAGIASTYTTEIRKGINLARYVREI